MTAKDIKEFIGYLRTLTDAQIQGVYDKESSAGRDDYAELVINEAERRGIHLDAPYDDDDDDDDDNDDDNDDDDYEDEEDEYAY